MVNTTNVRACDLNYDHYTNNKYDRDIINAIPYHKEIHRQIAAYIQKHFKRDYAYSVLDLGAGTGITSRIIKDILPKTHFDLVDFSQRMLNGAKKQLGNKNVHYIKTDYARMKFDCKYNIILSVIGFHHQTHAGKKRLIKKIYRALKPGGVFVLGDLVTYRNKLVAATNNALHFHHLVEKSSNRKTLAEWAHHHMFLNRLEAIEDLEAWMGDIGFKIIKKYHRFNTALIIGKK